MKNGQKVREFEEAFAAYVGAKYAIALSNGTATLHTALVSLGVKPGDEVATTPLTMSATTLAILHAGARPRFIDVDPDTWLMERRGGIGYSIPVDLYGLRSPYAPSNLSVNDAAQTLRKHGPHAFTSYSLQASKILSTGEGGMLVTNDQGLAQRAREFSSLGYRMAADQPRIDPSKIKSPTFNRHYSIGFNYRMNDVTAAEGLKQLANAKQLLANRKECSDLYRGVIKDCPWLKEQKTPDGWQHDNWCFAFAVGSPELWNPLVDGIVRHGGERPYAAWKLTYDEEAFKHLAPKSSAYPHGCGWAEDIQPRLIQMQTNDVESAKKNAEALRIAIDRRDYAERLGRIGKSVASVYGLTGDKAIALAYCMEGE